jgi:hypothetical protein
MPRLRAAAVSEGDVPVELFDAHDPAWSTAKRTESWLERHGLSSRNVKAYGPFSRWKAALYLWCVDAGWTNTYGASTYPVIDLHRTTAAGIPQYGSQATWERVKAAAIVVRSGVSG